MQSLGDSREGTLPITSFGLTISPEDELQITVSSPMPEVAAEYNTGQLYTVDNDGNIFFPKIGNIHVSGMTTTQLRNYIKERVDVKDAYVTVKIINFRIDVMGEVMGPRRISVDSEKFSIFDALAAAGDMTPYGRRDNVTVIREDGDSLKYYKLDLRDANITSSPYYYLRPNDVIIVDANDIKQENSKYNQNNAFKLSVISTIVSAVSVLASLVIALVIK